MTLETDIMEQIRDGKLALPSTVITIVGTESRVGSGGRADCIIDLQWEGKRCRFVAEVKKLATPRAIQQAMATVKAMASPPESYPMIIVPYLAPARLEELRAAGVSGLDLCGNGVIVVPDKVLILCSGQRNRFPQSAKLRNIYRGKNSLVARVFLIQSRFARVNDIFGLLAKRGGHVVLSTVSKVLQRLEDDLIISRADGIRLIQADTLMEKLTENYEPPTITERFRGKCDLSREELCRRLAVAASTRGGKLMLTGTASVEKLAVYAAEPITSFYCTSMPASLLSAANIDAKETDRFANIELLRTTDARVYFDPRAESGVPFASPIQAWLELVVGDKRQKDAAEQVRRGILIALGNVREDSTHDR